MVPQFPPSIKRRCVSGTRETWVAYSFRVYVKEDHRYATTVHTSDSVPPVHRYIDGTVFAVV